MRLPKTVRICDSGHQYYKSSDCPTCPICESERTPKSAFLVQLSAPARRALISTLEELSKYSEKEILQLHGMGPASLPKLRDALATEGLAFKSS